MNVRRLLTAAALVPALALPGCDWVGEKENVVREAKTEGIYVDVGALDYQVQISRQLNPAVSPDKGYFAGLPDYVSDLTEDEVWFGVSVRVQNQTKQPHESADKFVIEETTGETFTPIDMSEDDNPLAYSARTIQPGETYPAADELAGDSPTQGGMLLFKIPYSSLGNRPLEFTIEADGEEAVVDLDV
jgi:hypothetical protein